MAFERFLTVTSCGGFDLETGGLILGIIEFFSALVSLSNDFNQSPVQYVTSSECSLT